MKNILFFPLFLILFFIIIPAFTQEDTQIELEQELFNEIEYNEDSIFVIKSFVYNVKGITMPYALNHKAEFKVGEEITGISSFEKFIKDKTQLLVNERVLKDNVLIDYTIGELTEDEKYPVDLVIFVEDTWNIIALPYPKYSSNYGLELTIKARDYNFLGTMRPLRMDLGYKYDQNGRSFYNIMIDSDYPFEAFGLNWNLGFDNYFNYRPDLEHPLYYKNRTGISVGIPIKRSTFTISFSESFIVNEENADADKPLYGEVQEGLYMVSYPYVSWSIPLGLNIGEYGELNYRPFAGITINHELPNWPLTDYRIGPFISFSHTLSFGRINWKGNIRQGFSAYITNSYGYSFYYHRNLWNPWSQYYGFQGIGHFVIIDEILGISARMNHRHWIESSHDHAGDVLRGIYDKDVTAEFMFAFNFDLNIRALRIMPSTWFPNNRLMRIFDFDMFMNPICDIAVYKDPTRDFSFSKENFLLGAGMEVIVFPHRFRSMFFRVSAAFDFSDISERTPMELFLGMELHY